ncbi:MAG TPA: hypothetical protein VFI25_10595 [Planctomycetota bacterium]|nr:hypothetical protein [Planctomycetota bacterium]
MAGRHAREVAGYCVAGPEELYVPAIDEIQKACIAWRPADCPRFCGARESSRTESVPAPV